MKCPVGACCQCTAGLMGLCNHIGGELFLIEAAILQGLTHPSCISILAKWNIAKLKIKAEAVKLKESVFTKPYYKKKATHDKEKYCRTKKDFLDFSPVPESQNEYVKDGKRVRNNIFNSLGHSIKSSCFYELQTCSRRNQVHEKTFVLPKNLPEVAMSLPEGTATSNINNLSDAMKITK